MYNDDADLDVYMQLLCRRACDSATGWHIHFTAWVSVHSIQVYHENALLSYYDFHAQRIDHPFPSNNMPS